MENISKYPRGIELVGGTTIENSNGEILMTQSPKWNNKWCIPGGHIEPGEMILEALTREGKEETNLDLEGVSVYYWGELINSKDFHRPAHFIFFDAYCRVVGGEVKLDEKELNDFKWLKPEEALKLDLAESYAESINKFIEYKAKILS
jgi:nucleoside triphosphatase